MTAAEIAALVTAAVALMGAAAAYLRSRATQTALSSHLRRSAEVRSASGQSCSERHP